VHQLMCQSTHGHQNCTLVPQTVYKSWQLQPEALCCLCLLVAGGGRELLVDSEVFNGDISTNGFSNKSWPAGLHVQDFFWGELVLSEGAPFECLTPDGRAKVCESLAGCQTNAAGCSCDQVASCTWLSGLCPATIHMGPCGHEQLDEATRWD
jgi:hypothetical protein